MAVIRAFKALRPDEKLAHLVASVPYDVVNRKEAAELILMFSLQKFMKKLKKILID